MEEWSRIVDLILNSLPGLPDAELIGEWLKGILPIETEMDRVDTIRLGASLAIDLQNNALPAATAESVRELLRKLDRTKAQVGIQFGHLLEGHSDRQKLFCTSRYNSDAFPDQYCTVMKMENFIACAGHVFGFTDSDHDREEVRLLSGKFEARPLTGFDGWWTGPNRIVWVTPAQHLTSALVGVADGERGITVVGMLGIRPYFVTPTVELLAVRYPSKFGKPCYQPTTLDAWWKDAGQYYLSYRDDDSWGRAWNCTSRGPQGTLERIHAAHPWEDLGDHYGLLYIGHVTQSQLSDHREIVGDEVKMRLGLN